MPNHDDRKGLYLAAETAWLSSGYLAVCTHMAEAIKDGHFDRNPGRDLAMLFLCHHALELHFKAAIRAAGKTPPNVHDLRRLNGEYDSYYPNQPVTIPSSIEMLGKVPDDLFPNSPAPTAEQIHQRLRYVANQRGEIFPEISEFEPTQFSKELADVQKQTIPVFLEIIHRWAQ